MKNRFKNIWLKFTIRKKITTFTVMVFMIITIAILMEVLVTKVSLTDLNDILDANVKAVEVVEALQTEINVFKEYISKSETEQEHKLQSSMADTFMKINGLRPDLAIMDEEQYSQIWSLINCYEVYLEKRNEVLRMSRGNVGYINKLYEVYDIQSYLQVYARRVMESTLAEGSHIYQEKIPFLLSVPIIAILLNLLLLWGMIKMAGAMKSAIVVPIMEMAKVAKKVAANDFFAEDVVVENKDEIGDLVTVFNKMKFATGKYIHALEEQKKTQELLHKEELEKLEVEKRLDIMNLQLLKNQINPHFLFNTLNVIGGMANLEEAETTEKMIKALSALFRYNLKTHDAEVPLGHELKVIEDYMYIQQMRFGSRISYDIDCRVDKNSVKVPVFTFQPLVENAIIHGLAKKEEGGRIRVRIWQNDGYTKFVIMDQGVGIEKYRLMGLKLAIEDTNTDFDGIGVGNVFRRIMGMYEGSRVNILSKQNIGTIIKIEIPQGIGENYVSHIDS